MSIQEEENYNIDIKKHVSIKKEQDKTNLSPLEVNRHDYNVISYSNNFPKKRISFQGIRRTLLIINK
jgi:hypothetical protein